VENEVAKVITTIEISESEISSIFVISQQLLTVMNTTRSANPNAEPGCEVQPYSDPECEIQRRQWLKLTKAQSFTLEGLRWFCYLGFRSKIR